MSTPRISPCEMGNSVLCSYRTDVNANLFVVIMIVTIVLLFISAQEVSVTS